MRRSFRLLSVLVGFLGSVGLAEKPHGGEKSKYLDPFRPVDIHIFTSDKSNPQLGKAWRDPSRMIWGDIVKKEDGSPRLMNHKDATDYCQRIGAQLPSREDFIRLREYLGAKSGTHEGYKPGTFFNLMYTDTFGHYFWSSSVHPGSNVTDVFSGRDGYIDPHNVANLYSVRCVQETKVTKTGHIFTRDKSNPQLGKAWRDPSRMIWGDIVKKEDGSLRLMNRVPPAAARDFLHVT